MIRNPPTELHPFVSREARRTETLREAVGLKNLDLTKRSGSRFHEAKRLANTQKTRSHQLDSE